MSDVITGGIALAAVGACAVVAGAAMGVGRAVYKGMTWLPEKAQEELDRLDRELEAPPSYVTTGEARAEFKKQLQRLRAKVADNPTLKDHAEAASRIVALRKSPLGRFVGKEQWQRLSRSKVGQKTFTDIVGQASQRFTQANTVYVTGSVAEVAAKEGFTRERFNYRDKGKRTLVMEDSEGRALVAEIGESNNGATINLDLTGFGDGSCHAVMDRVLKGLAEKDIRLEGMTRRAHYRREGVLKPSLKHSQRKRRVPRQTRPDKVSGGSDAHRRRHHNQTNQLKLKG